MGESPAIIPAVGNRRAGMSLRRFFRLVAVMIGAIPIALLIKMSEHCVRLSEFGIQSQRLIQQIGRLDRPCLGDKKWHGAQHVVVGGQAGRRLASGAFDLRLHYRGKQLANYAFGYPVLKVKDVF